MVTLRGDRIDSAPLADVAGRTRTVPPDHELVRTARSTGVMLGT